MTKTHSNDASASAVPYEQLICSLPITIRRRARFGECDPAGLVYTPVFSEYAMSAYFWTMEVLLKEPLLSAHKRMNFISPIRALSFEFFSGIKADQLFDMVSTVGEIRNRTFDLQVIGRSVAEDSEPLFTVRLSPIVVTPGHRGASSLPHELRLQLEQYKAHTAKLASNAD